MNLLQRKTDRRGKIILDDDVMKHDNQIGWLSHEAYVVTWYSELRAIEKRLHLLCSCYVERLQALNMARVGNEDEAKFYCTKHSWRGKYVA